MLLPLKATTSFDVQQRGNNKASEIDFSRVYYNHGRQFAALILFTGCIFIIDITDQIYLYYMRTMETIKQDISMY